MIALHHENYRKEDIEVIARWIKANQSGVILGINGVGKSNFFQYLTENQKEIQKKYLGSFGEKPFVIIPFDLNYMPDERPSTLPRMILRAFYEARGGLGHSLQNAIQHNYDNYFLQDDVLVSWTAVKDILLHFKDQNHKVIFLLDRFEEFPNFVTEQMLDTLRGLRDNFKRTLLYLISMGNDDNYQTAPMLFGEFHDLIDINYTWLKPLVSRDAEHVIKKRTYYAEEKPTKEDMAHFIALSGGYPALLVAICRWWYEQGKGIDSEEWISLLLKKHGVVNRLQLIWDCIDRNEGKALKIWLGSSTANEALFPKLEEMGILKEAINRYEIVGQLLKEYIKIVKIDDVPTILMDKNRDFFKNGERLTLSELESRLLELFTEYPGEKLHKDYIINNVWPRSALLEGVSDENLQQLIRSLRVKLENNPSKPIYIMTKRGSRYRDGGYIFYPEGDPKVK